MTNFADGFGRTDGNGNRAEPVEIWKARTFIRNHCEEKLSLALVANSVNISPNYLSEKFKEVTGENLVRYISRIRLEKARSFLDHGNRRVSEIAFAVGFQSLSQFNRAFKKQTGKSPSEYRETRAHQNGSDSQNGNRNHFSVKMRSR